MRKLQELDIPESLVDEEEAMEFVRFWIGDAEDHVTLNIGAFAREHEATSWGMIAADIVKHAMRGMLEQDPSRNPEQVLAEIEAAFRDRLSQNLNLTGQLRGETH